MYALIIHNYLTNSHTIVDIFVDKYNALHKLEELIYSYIYDRIGYHPKVVIYNEVYSTTSTRWKTHPFGLLLCRNANLSQNKLSIYNKVELKGILYDSYKVKLNFESEVVELPDKLIDNFTDYEHVEIPPNGYKDYYTNWVIPSLKKAEI
jgi:hypothetical protein